MRISFEKEKITVKILVDTHTHTNVSTHALSTLIENIDCAKAKGLEMLVTTNHTPSLVDSAHIWHFTTIANLPKVIKGLKHLAGAELNILDTAGNIDLPEAVLKKMDVLIASIHDPVYLPKTFEEHTKTWLNVIKNPYVDILGHSGHPSYQYDHEVVIKAAKEADKCIEINNHSYLVREGSAEICRDIALMCKKIGTKIVVSTDSHFCYDIGDFDMAVKMLEDIDFPEELVMNLNAERFTKYIENKKGKTFDFSKSVG